jgi:hypothetical protein
MSKGEINMEYIFIRDNQNNPVGVVAAMAAVSQTEAAEFPKRRIIVASSLCRKGDQFNKEIGIKIARGRLHKGCNFDKNTWIDHDGEENTVAYLDLQIMWLTGHQPIRRILERDISKECIEKNNIKICGLLNRVGKSGIGVDMSLLLDTDAVFTVGRAKAGYNGERICKKLVK